MAGGGELKMTQPAESSQYFAKPKTSNNEYDGGSAVNVSWISGSGSQGSKAGSKGYSVERQVLKNSDMNQYK